MNESYSIGYKKPPLGTRFLPGRSGNPKGRPKGAKGFDNEVKEELAQKVTVVEGGRRRKITKQSAMIKALINKAMKGDTNAVKAVTGLAGPAASGVDLKPDEANSIDQLILAQFLKQSSGEPGDAA